MKDSDIFNVFFREKPAMMLINLKNGREPTTYASALAKDIDCTYSHVVKILQDMETAGLVMFEKKGRLKLLSLTKRGKDVAEFVHNIKFMLENKQSK